MTADDLAQLIFAGRGAAELPTFLAEGGDVNALVARSGMRMLHSACEHMNFDAIRALVSAGADLNAKDAHGAAPLHAAVDIDIDSVIQANGREIRFETTRLLLSLGADLNVQDGQGQTPRQWAADYGNFALEQFDRAVSHSD